MPQAWTGLCAIVSLAHTSHVPLGRPLVRNEYALSTFILLRSHTYQPLSKFPLIYK